MVRVAVTGGIGSGKSLAMQYFAKIGYPVFSCDEIYKTVIQTQSYIEQVAKIFPEVLVNGSIDRGRLAKLVFNDSLKLKQLNAIAHPMIMQNLLGHMDKCTEPFVFAEVPLLFEGNFEGLFDKVIYLYRNDQSRITDVTRRDGISETDVLKRMAAQFNPNSVEGK